MSIDPFKVISNHPSFIGLEGINDETGIRSYGKFVAGLCKIPVISSLMKLFGFEIVDIKDISEQIFHLDRHSLKEFIVRHQGCVTNEELKVSDLRSACLEPLLSEISKKHSRKEIVQIAESKNELAHLRILTKQRDSRPLTSNGKRNWSINEKEYDAKLLALEEKITSLEKQLLNPPQESPQKTEGSTDEGAEPVSKRPGSSTHSTA
jgi:hypothetical protein